MPTLQEITSRRVIWVYRIEKGETQLIIHSHRYMNEIEALFGTDLVQIVDGYSVKKIYKDGSSKKIYKGEW